MKSRKKRLAGSEWGIRNPIWFSEFRTQSTDVVEMIGSAILALAHSIIEVAQHLRHDPLAQDATACRVTHSDTRLRTPTASAKERLRSGTGTFILSIPGARARKVGLCLVVQRSASTPQANKQRSDVRKRGHTMHYSYAECSTAERLA